MKRIRLCVRRGPGHRRSGGWWAFTCPRRVVKGTVVCTEPTDFISHCTVMTPDVTFRQKRDGTFYVSNGTRSDYYVDLQSLRNFGLFIRNFLRVKKTMNVHVGKELFEDVLRALPGSPAKAHPSPTPSALSPSLMAVLWSSRLAI